METSRNGISDEEFYRIYSRVPRLTIDIVIHSPEGVVLALRDILPWKGSWHLPGGTVYKGELLREAALRIAKGETGLDISVGEALGYMEFPAEVRKGGEIHTVSIVLDAQATGGKLRHDADSKDIRYFKEWPENMIPEHGATLKKYVHP